MNKRRKAHQESPQTRQRRDELKRRGYVSPAEASALSKTPLQTIYTWIRAGRLDSLRIGARRVFVPLEGLRRLTAGL